ncbi:MAG: transcription elongation factor GreA [Rickettsiales bacterium]|jgi:transcription elongation factor GreA|nr:transcription elongation factor GreA [Rickettsiales bacterium]
MNKRFKITKLGYDKLKDDLTRLIEVERASISKAIGEAIALGDLSENQEYSSMKEKQEVVETKISAVNAKLSNAEIVDVRNCGGDYVDFGAIVCLVDEDAGREIRYQLLSECEVDPKRGIISIESPIGVALVGKEKDEIVEIKTPGGIKTYRIVDIEWGKLL